MSHPEASDNLALLHRIQSSPVHRAFHCVVVWEPCITHPRTPPAYTVGRLAGLTIQPHAAVGDTEYTVDSMP